MAHVSAASAPADTAGHRPCGRSRSGLLGSLSSTARAMWRARWLYLLALPGMVYFVLFQYLPILGNAIAFKDYSPFLGFWESPWVGFGHFRRLLQDPEVAGAIGNTLSLSLLQIVFAFPAPIVVALLLNELAGERFKRVIQSVVYLPHFISWVIIVGIFYQLLGADGLANQSLRQVGQQPIGFLTSPEWFRPLIILEIIWRETGWGTIIFLAALTGIDQQLYEAARIDGAGRWRQMWHVTLPGIRPVVVLMFILQLGKVMDSGFEQIFLQRNASNVEVAEVLDTFVYFRGLLGGDFGFAAAAGLFKGLVGLVLILAANRLARRAGEEGVF